MSADVYKGIEQDSETDLGWIYIRPRPGIALA